MLHNTLFSRTGVQSFCNIIIPIASSELNLRQSSDLIFEDGGLLTFPVIIVLAQDGKTN